MDALIDFLKNVTPFNVLPIDVLAGVANTLQEIRYSKDTIIYKQEVSRMKGIDIIVKGEYETFFYDSDQNKRLPERYSNGYCYGGVSVLLNRTKSLRTVIAKKGTVVYLLPRKEFKALCQAYDEFFHYFTKEFGKRMLNDEYAHFYKRPAFFAESYIATDQLYSKKIESVEVREIVSASVHTPIYEGAKIMADNKVSCLFIKDDDKKVIGFVTDLLLRDKVVAAQVNVQSSLEAVMDKGIVSINSQAYVYEAILMMFRTKTRYLLVEKDGVYNGFISRNKLLSEQTQSPLAFIQSVKQAVSYEELNRKWKQVPQMVSQLSERGVNAEIINQVITTISDTIAIKVIENVITEVGPPPAKFTFMVLGSEGRKEQTLKTDQDNAIIYEDKANEQRELVRNYFLDFADKVSHKLDFIGFSYCTGGFMANNPKWTHSLSHWKKNYNSWMEETTPENAIKYSTFFDCRYIYGDATIMDDLKSHLEKQLMKPSDKFFYDLANNALQYEPPLTFFKNIKTTTIGEQEVFDIKKAMTPIVDLIRVYALKNKIFEVNTGERLKALKTKEIFTEAAYHELSQSYYFLMSLRLKNQARQIIFDKIAPNNYINIRHITKIEQVTIKEIFKTIENFQGGIKVKFTNNLLG
jgi:CBS domain-containing protein